MLTRRSVRANTFRDMYALTPVVRTPQRVRSHHESRVKGVSRKRRAKARVKPDPYAQFDLFKAIFGDPKFAPPPTVGATAASR